MYIQSEDCTQQDGFHGNTSFVSLCRTTTGLKTGVQSLTEVSNKSLENFKRFVFLKEFAKVSGAASRRPCAIGVICDESALSLSPLAVLITSKQFLPVQEIAAAHMLCAELFYHFL